MRAGSLSKEPVLSKLRDRYVCGYRNIMKDKYAGNSGIHPVSGPAVTTTNGAGPRNLQLFVLAKDGTVVHCLPGYWNPNDLSHELDFADRMHRVWMDNSITEPQKRALFAQEQVRHIQTHSPEVAARSELQGFDKQFVYKNHINDAIANASLIPADWHDVPKEAFKTTDVIVHERLAKQPFANYETFNVAQFVNYGSHHYDKHEKDLEPETMANVRAHSLRDVLHETDAPKAAVTNVAARPPAVSTAAAAYHPVFKPQEFEKKMADGFWGYARTGDWAKAERVASLMLEKRPGSPSGHEMKAVVAYGKGRYAEAYFHSYNAIRMGSKHPTIVGIYQKSRTAASSSKP
ncbi:MAG: hypothetical protein C0507_01270 [Cyanobacteria bacterium PR.3.49]|nr:hypothetical protein [Cyanobacteria bacterium PR.3.49]